jgi:hypothetical protein
MALNAAMQELVWLRGVIKELKCEITVPTPFLVDSQSAKDLAENPVFYKRSKHIDIKYHWIREHVNSGGFETAKLYHCQTNCIAADIFTKSLNESPFFEHATTLNGKRIRSSDDFLTNTKSSKSRR